MEVQVTHPRFVCEELVPLTTNLSSYVEKALDALPAAQKTAAHAQMYFIGIGVLVCCSSLAYAAITFTAAPLAITLASSVFLITMRFISDKIFGSSHDVYFLKSLRILMTSKSFLTNPDFLQTEFLETFLDGIDKQTNRMTKETLNAELKQQLIQLRFFGYSQVALNYFRNVCFETDEVKIKMETHSFTLQGTGMSKLEELQDVHYLGKMRDAAKTALDCYFENKESLPSNINSHTLVLDLLNSTYRRTPDSVESNSIEKANLFVIDKAVIKKAVSNKNEKKIPMVSTTRESLKDLLDPSIQLLQQQQKNLQRNNEI
jgi:hypothetical protein